jgi:glycosyltransferase involved in cell wall biosynthesis
MPEEKVMFLIANFPYTADITDEEVWCFVQREVDRDFPWLLPNGYWVTLSGVGRGWRGVRKRGPVVSHARWPGTGWIPLDATLAWFAHFLDAVRASRQGRVVGIAPMPEAGLGVALARSLRSDKVRLVVRVQGHTASRALLVRRSKLRFMLLDRIESFVLQRADLVVPMGRFTKELAIRKGANPNKIIILPFPVRWADSASVAPFPSQPCVLFVGRLEKEKGVHVLLEAMCQVREAIPSVRLLVARDGSYRRELEVRADRLGLRSHVSFLGWIEAADLRVAYKEAWVLVLPSIWAEGLGMVLVEAGLMGRPVIGSDLGGIRDIIQHGHNGLLVPPGDSKALAEAILTILTNRNLAQQMGLANLETAQKYLSQRNEALEQVHCAILALVEKQ